MVKDCKFHHIGMASKNIDDDVEKFKSFFGDIKISNKYYDPLQNAELCMINLNGINIELISGVPVMSFLQRRNRLYHLCFETKNITKSIDEFVSKGAILISEPKEDILFNGRKVAFILLQDSTIIELLEE